MHKNHPAARGVVLVILPIGEEAGDETRGITAQPYNIGNLCTSKERQQDEDGMGIRYAVDHLIEAIKHGCVPPYIQMRNRHRDHLGI